MNFAGIIIGISSFLIIGVFHPIVIKSEYYFSDKVWPIFLIGGLGLAFASIFIQNYILSTIVSVAGFSMLWAVGELKEQTERVRKGWFPKNPNRKYDFDLENK